MGKVHSLLRKHVGVWRDDPPSQKTAKDIAVAATVASMAALSVGYLYKVHIAEVMHTVRLLTELAGGLTFLWFRTDPHMDALAASSVTHLSRAQHDAAVRKYIEKLSQDKMSDQRKQFVIGHDKSNSFGRPAVRSMPRFVGRAVVDLPEQSSGPCTISVEPGMSMDQLLAATLDRFVILRKQKTVDLLKNMVLILWRSGVLFHWYVQFCFCVVKFCCRCRFTNVKWPCCTGGDRIPRHHSRWRYYGWST